MIPAFLVGTHVATIEAYTGAGTWGPTYDTAVTGILCHMQGNRQMVRSGSGDEVVSEWTVWFDAGTVCPPGSRVTIGSVVGYVITTRDMFTDGRLPLDHVEVTL